MKWRCGPPNSQVNMMWNPKQIARKGFFADYRTF